MVNYFNRFGCQWQVHIEAENNRIQIQQNKAVLPRTISAEAMRPCGFFLSGVPNEQSLLVGVEVKITFHCIQKVYVDSEDALKLRGRGWQRCRVNAFALGEIRGQVALGIKGQSP
jgi:hypothetical protein